MRSLVLVAVVLLVVLALASNQTSSPVARLSELERAKALGF